MKKVLGTAGLTFLAAASLPGATIVTVDVPARTNIYFAGMPNGTTSTFGDSAPAVSPVVVSGIAITPGEILTFQTITGTWVNCPIEPFFPAEGDIARIFSHDNGAENGISNITGPLNGLIGVFLDASAPNLAGAPTALNFTTQAARDYASLSPLLKQVFYIGNGFTSGGQLQQIVIPNGATRLFLAHLDSAEWNNNAGVVNVTFMSTATVLATTTGTTGTTSTGTTSTGTTTGSGSTTSTGTTTGTTSTGTTSGTGTATGTGTSTSTGTTTGSGTSTGTTGSGTATTGSGSSQPPGTGGTTVIPEPSTVALVAAGLLLIAARRR